LTDTELLIAGSGPAGLLLAIEAGQRGVPCVLVDQNAAAPTFPKANLTNARTMEHFRRLGFAAEIRALGLPADYSPDVAYFTRYAKHELARFHVPSSSEVGRLTAATRGNWLTPEFPHRVQQTLVEAVLRAKVASLPSVETRFGWRVVRVEPNDEGAVCKLEAVSGERLSVSASFVAGCDGPRSLVRERLGIRYTGQGGEAREFLGGRMMAIHLRSRAIYDRINGGPAWQYWSINRERRGALISIDGRETFIFYVQLPDGVQPNAAFAFEALRQAMGAEVEAELLGTGEWTAGHTLVAERFGEGRLMLLGDAAHLFTPTGGLGYNTAIEDAANLGWKLAAVTQGWGGPGLIASYECERKPAAQRATNYARAMADSVGRLAIPENLEADTSEGAAARQSLGERMHAHAAAEFNTSGLQLGTVYESPVIATDGSAPLSTPTHYVPTSCPGARAPHVTLVDGASILDRFGEGFTLLRLGRSPVDVEEFRRSAAARRVPLKIVDVPDAAARDIYDRDLILVRPDQHIVWRGNLPPPDLDAMFACATGWLLGS
jgi:2-polyprenyl-6-methoxyphenol hydroxylase-like FAD-dependent oxidoreductase